MTTRALPFRAAIWLVCLLVCPDFAGATQARIAAQCDAAARHAARATDVPLDVLRAITRTETGQTVDGTLMPWPWTINDGTSGTWYATADAANAAAFRLLKSGRQSFDVGCFQINYKWHGDAFTSLEQMFEPRANARYAAGFLKDLYRETGSWPAAAAAYHSRTPTFAKRYKARYEKIHASLPDALRAAPTDLFARRAALVGGLFGGGSPHRGHGSLVPARKGDGP